MPAAMNSAAPGGSTAMAAALGALAQAAPNAAALIRSAAVQGSGLLVTFSPSVMSGLSSGTLHLMSTSTGETATAVDAAGRIVANGRVVGGGVGAAAGVTLGAAAMAILPLAIVGAAACAQQAALEEALASIRMGIERIEVRLSDADNGVCDAAERFIKTAVQSLESGPLTPYLRQELASHRSAVDALHGVRHRHMQRVHRKIRKKRSWPDEIVDLVGSGEFQRESILYLRTLLCRTKFDTLAALCLIDEGRSDAALRMLHDSAEGLQTEFLEFHERLGRLTRNQPEASMWDQLPLVGGRSEEAHKAAKALSRQIDKHVLPLIAAATTSATIDLHLTPRLVSAIGEDPSRRRSMSGRRELRP